MAESIVRSQGERILLIAIAILGAIGLNGVFLMVVLREESRRLALSDPLAWALMIEALVVTGLLAWAFARRAIGRIGPVWFWVLSLLGGLAFSVPIAFLSDERGKSDVP